MSAEHVIWPKTEVVAVNEFYIAFQCSASGTFSEIAGIGDDDQLRVVDFVASGCMYDFADSGFIDSARTVVCVLYLH